MPRYRLEKGEDFHFLEESLRKRIEGFFNREYDVEKVSDITKEMCEKTGFGGFYIPSERLVKIDSLPFTIEEWPLGCGRDQFGFDIGKIKVIKDNKTS